MFKTHKNRKIKNIDDEQHIDQCKSYKATINEMCFKYSKTERQRQTLQVQHNMFSIRML